MKYLDSDDMNELRFLLLARISKLESVTRQGEQDWSEHVAALRAVKHKLDNERIAHNYYYEGKEA
jgi:hypothetical protein